MSKSHQTQFRCKLSPLTIALCSLLFAAGVRASEKKNVPSEIQNNIEFDASFLNVDDKQTVDLSRFSTGSAGSPGVYKTALYINEQLFSNSDIEFKQRPDKTVYPCLTLNIIKNISFDYNRLPDNFIEGNAKPDMCIDLRNAISDVKVNYDSNEQRLDITIPQIYMQKTARGTISPELWDSGISALLLGYSVNGYTSESQGATFNSLFAGVNAGLNVGAWYLRHNGAYSQMSNGNKKYNNINTYLQRDIPILKARILAGQANTTGDLFNTLPFTGVQLATDERMLPESLRGYAPQIRGVARTNARVTVRQSGQAIYETTVPPGPFQINDLYPTGYGGDLEVTVHENDGNDQTFLVPYAAVAQLLRPGASRYTVTAGEIRSDYLRQKPAIYQATYQRGVTNRTTAYSGLQLSQDYYAFQFGTALGTPVGAIAFDVTQARTHLGKSANNKPVNKSLSGQSYQLSYSKLINETKSNFSLAAYRFSTDGYMDFMTAMQTRDAVDSGYSPDSISRAKNRMTMTVGQGLPDEWGQLYLSGSMQNYWNKHGTDKQYQLGYNNRYKKLSYGITVSRTFSNIGAAQTNYMLGFSLPLGRSDQIHTPQLRTDLSHDTYGRTAQQVTISGTTGVDSQFSYGVTAMHANQDTGSSGSASANYRGPIASMNGSFSAGQNYRSASAGMNGTVVAHSGGITFSPYTSDTFALIEANGAEGATVPSYPGVKIDSNGYALVPYLNPYQMNDVSIDPKGISNDVEFESTSQKVAPFSGAVVKMKYGTKRGIPVLINSARDGQPLPFGADVLDKNGDVIGSVGQGSQIYARVAEDKGQLRVKWGDSQSMQCNVNYLLIPQPKGQQRRPIQTFNSPCSSL